MSGPVRPVTVWLAWRHAPLAPAQRARLVSTLSDDELVRAGRYEYAADAERFRWSRAVQRAILAAHLEVDARALRFHQAGDGKPALVAPAGHRCEYNASHSGELFALAVAEHAVGVDVERRRDVPRLERIARRLLAGPVAETICAAPSGEREARFFTAWTQLEAHAKLHGHGVWRLLAQRDAHAAAEGVRVASFEAPPGYFGAVAVAGGEPQVTVRWWEPEHQRG